MPSTPPNASTAYAMRPDFLSSITSLISPSRSPAVLYTFVPLTFSAEISELVSSTCSIWCRPLTVLLVWASVAPALPPAHRQAPRDRSVEAQAARYPARRFAPVDWRVAASVRLPLAPLLRIKRALVERFRNRITHCPADRKPLANTATRCAISTGRLAGACTTRKPGVSRRRAFSGVGGRRDPTEGRHEFNWRICGSH